VPQTGRRLPSIGIQVVGGQQEEEGTGAVPTTGCATVMEVVWNARVCLLLHKGGARACGAARTTQSHACPMGRWVGAQPCETQCVAHGLSRAAPQGGCHKKGEPQMRRWGQKRELQEKKTKMPREQGMLIVQREGKRQRRAENVRRQCNVVQVANRKCRLSICCRHSMKRLGATKRHSQAREGGRHEAERVQHERWHRSYGKAVTERVREAGR